MTLRILSTISNRSFQISLFCTHFALCSYAFCYLWGPFGAELSIARALPTDIMLAHPPMVSSAPSSSFWSWRRAPDGFPLVE